MTKCEIKDNENFVEDVKPEQSIFKNLIDEAQSIEYEIQDLTRKIRLIEASTKFNVRCEGIGSYLLASNSFSIEDEKGVAEIKASLVDTLKRELAVQKLKLRKVKNKICRCVKEERTNGDTE